MEVEKFSPRPKFCADCQSKFSFTRTHKSIPLNITLKLVLRSKVLIFEIFCQFTSVYPNIPGSNLEEKGEKRKGGKEKRKEGERKKRKINMLEERVYINTHSEQGRRPTAGEAPKGPRSQPAAGKIFGGKFSEGEGENFLIHILWGTMYKHKTNSICFLLGHSTNLNK